MKLIKLTKQQSQIVESNHNLIYGFIHSRNLDLEEYYGILAIELCKSVIHWKKDRGKLSTYFYMRAESAIIREHQKRNSLKRKANLKTKELDLDICVDNSLDNSKELLLGEIMNCGNPDVIRLKYEGYSQEEIAQALDLTQPEVSRMLARAYEIYKKKEEELDK